MNSAHLISRYLPRATATEMPDGTLLLEVDPDSHDRFVLAIFCGLAMLFMLFGALVAITQHMTVTA